MDVRKISETDRTVTVAFTPPAGGEAYEIIVDGDPVLQDGKRHFFYDPKPPRTIGKVLDGKPHAYGIRALNVAADGAVTVPAVTDPGMPTLDAFRAVVEPNNHEPVPGSANNYGFAWTAWHSPATPREAPNGRDPAARYLFRGDHVFFLKGICRESGYVNRDVNGHAVAVPGVGWEAEVSSFARDSMGRPGETGMLIEYILEYEVVQDPDHSGGAHFGIPDAYSEAGRMTWLLHELKLGNQRDGIFRCWDWLAGKSLISLDGVNTLKPGQNWMQLWEGGYNDRSDLMPVAGVQLATPALFGPSIDEMLKDRPMLAGSTWHSVPKAAGANTSRIDLGVQRVTVPRSPLMQAA